MARASTKKPDEKKLDIIIIGAGIVGVSTALELQRKGLSVTLIDKTAVSYTHLTLPTKA